MPHITLECTGNIAGSVDGRALAKAVHATVVDVAGGRAGGCKTRIVVHDTYVIADGSDHYAMLHAEISLLSGRTPETKRRLSEAVLRLLREHTAPAPQFEVQFSVDVRDLDRESYARHDEPRTRR
jgi:5-carboxymethyl-2-hydroxymuconate isomerase